MEDPSEMFDYTSKMYDCLKLNDLEWKIKLRIWKWEHRRKKKRYLS